MAQTPRRFTVSSLYCRSMQQEPSGNADGTDTSAATSKPVSSQSLSREHNLHDSQLLPAESSDNAVSRTGCSAPSARARMPKSDSEPHGGKHSPRYARTSFWPADILRGLSPLRGRMTEKAAAAVAPPAHFEAPLQACTDSTKVASQWASLGTVADCKRGSANTNSGTEIRGAGSTRVGTRSMSDSEREMWRRYKKRSASGSARFNGRVVAKPMESKWTRFERSRGQMAEDILLS